MKFKLYISSIACVFMLFQSTIVRAEDTNEKLGRISAVLNENTPADTEQKAANLLIAFSDLMGTLSSDIVTPLVAQAGSAINDSNSSLLNAKAAIQQYGNMTHPEVVRLLGELRTKIVSLNDVVVQLARGVQQTNTAVQSLSTKVAGTENLKQKFPEAFFVSSGALDQLLASTAEFATDYNNFAISIAHYETQLSEIRNAIEENDPALMDKLETVAATAQEAQNYSFEQIGAEFSSVMIQLQANYR